MPESNHPSRTGQGYYQDPIRMRGEVGVEGGRGKTGMRERGVASKTHMGMRVEIVNQDKVS